MKTFFLAAGVPLKSRAPLYYESADVVAIRESLRGFMAAILPKARMVFGGQPAITPMIRSIANDLGLDVRDHIILYQSKHFRLDFPPDNAAFERVVLTEDTGTREGSLRVLRDRMFSDYEYDAGVFIGGMEGVEVEWDLFRSTQPNALALPVASTGAAAKIIHDRLADPPSGLSEEFAYLHMFRSYLNI